MDSRPTATLRYARRNYRKGPAVDLQLKGRRALVTGSSSGIGTDIATMLVAVGCAVVGRGRNRERTEAAAASMKAAGVALGDLSTDEGVDTVHRAAVDALGGAIEILVNNAGGSVSDSATRPVLDITIAEWESNYRGNTLAAVRLAKRTVPDMV